MKMDKNVVRERAEQLYREGSFYCSEAVVKAVIESSEQQFSPEVVAVASGFPVGIGGSGCTCGAISGGIIALGLHFGRTEARSDKVNKCMALSNELYQRFVKRNRYSCCKVLTKGLTMGSPEHMAQCIRFTGEVAADTAELIAQNS